MSHTRALVCLLLQGCQPNLIMAYHLCALFNPGRLLIMLLLRQTLLYSLTRQLSTNLRRNGEVVGVHQRRRSRQIRGLPKHEEKNTLHQRLREKERIKICHHHYHLGIRIKDQPHHLWDQSSSLHRVHTSVQWSTRFPEENKGLIHETPIAGRKQLGLLQVEVEVVVVVEVPQLPDRHSQESYQTLTVVLLNHNRSNTQILHD